MTFTLEDKYKVIKNEIVKFTETDPIKIVISMMSKDFVSIHGPEHHFLDGASFLVAYKNCGGEINLTEALDELASRSVKMPGAMCGHWGVCGSTTSVGASLAIIHNTSPLSVNDFYQENMEYTSKVLNIMSKIGGPRCCKRNAFLSIINGVIFIKEKYGIDWKVSTPDCDFSNINQQCIKERCPFHKK